MFTVKQLKEAIESLSDDIVVIFESHNSEHIVNESYSIDASEKRFDTFIVLISHPE